MSYMQKLLRLLAILLLVFGFSFAQLASAFASSGSSTLSVANITVNSISVDKPNAKAGETVNFTVKASGDSGGAGLTNYGSLNVSLNGDEDDSSEYVSLYSENNDGVYTGNFTIPKYNADGKWTVSYIALSNNVGYGLDKSLSPSDDLNKTAFIQVTGSTIDKTAPTVSGISVDKKSVKAGDTVQFTVNASDNTGGVGLSDEMQMNVSLNGNKYKAKDVYLNLNDQGKYTGTFTVPKYNVNGKWTVTHISVNDTARNTLDKDLSVSNLLNGDAAITVTGGTIDKTAPTVSSISVDKPNAKAGETVNFTVKASDGSGAGLDNDGSLQVVLNGHEYGEFADSNVDLNSEKNDGVYTGSFTIPKYNANGKWTISHIDLADSVGNSLRKPLSASDPLNTAATFVVKDSIADTVTPSIESVKIDKANVKPGEKVHFTLTAADNDRGSGLSDNDANVEMSLNSDANSNQSVDLAPLGNGVYSGDLTIPKYNVNGKWTISNIGVSDKAGNYSNKDISPSDPLAVSFTVSGGLVDKNAPTIKSIKVNNQTPKPGETVTYTVTAADNSGGSGLSEHAKLRVNYDGQKDPNYDQDLWLTFNGKDQYSGSFEVPEFNSDGRWTVSYIDISDNQNNHSKRAITATDTLNATGSFAVTGSKVDKTAPKIGKLTVDNQSPGAGDDVHFVLTATDAGGSGLSGYGELKLVYTRSDGKQTQQTVYLDYDGDNQYSGDFTIPQYYSNGKWLISQINISDGEGNETNQAVKSNDPPNSTASFTVNGNATDKTAPVVDTKSLKIDKSKAGPYEKVHFTLNASDTGGSGFTDDTGAVVTLSCSDINNITQRDSVYLKYDGGNQFSGDYMVPKYNSDGKWTVTNIELSDAAGNEYNNRYTGKLSFDAYGSTKIAFQKIDVSKKYPKASDVVQLSLKPTISGEGPSWSMVLGVKRVGSKADSAWGRYDDIFYDFGLDLDYNSTSQAYEGDYRVPSNLPEGEYRVVTTCPINGKYTPGYPGSRSTDFALFTIDRTAPNAPKVNSLDYNATTVTGTAETNSKVTLKYGNTILGTATATSKGIYSLKLNAKQPLNRSLTVYAVDAAGNTSSGTNFKVVDKTAPGKPTINSFGNNSTTITGKAEAGSKVTIKYGLTILGSTITTSKGEFAIKVKSKQPSGRMLTVYLTDPAGNTSSGTSFKVADKTAPGKPSVSTFGNNSTTITGKAEPGSKVTIKYGKSILGAITATSKGVFTVKIKSKQPSGRTLTAYVTDKAGNTSIGTNFKVADKVPPFVPSVGKVTSKSTKITGRAEKGAFVFAYYGNSFVGKTTVNSKGSFSMKIRKQKKGIKLTLYAKDQAGNKSKVISVKVY